MGLYGVLAYTVAQRTREIGLRMALGAAPGRVRRMVLRQMGVMTAIGAAVGLGLAALAGRAAAVAAVRAEGATTRRLRGCRRCLLALDRPRRRIRARPPRLARGPDDGAPVRVTAGSGAEAASSQYAEVSAVTRDGIWSTDI